MCVCVCACMCVCARVCVTHFFGTVVEGQEEGGVWRRRGVCGGVEGGSYPALGVLSHYDSLYLMCVSHDSFACVSHDSFACVSHDSFACVPHDSFTP